MPSRPVSVDRCERSRARVRACTPLLESLTRTLTRRPAVTLATLLGVLGVLMLDPSVAGAARKDRPPSAQLSVTQLATPALTVNASGAGSTDNDATPIASYRFDFGDGSPTVTVNAPATSAQHTYAAAGTYTVRLTVFDTANLASSTVSTSISVVPDAPPVARLSLSQPATPPLTVNASGANSTDTDPTPIASYRFDFGDGSPPVTTNAPTSSASHAYAAAGTYTVTLVVTDTGNNVSAPVSSSITIQPEAAPVANLSVTQAASPALTVNASGAGSTDTDLTPIASYRFTFGDGTAPVTVNAPTSSASHTYAAAGTYTVTLVATDTGNNASAPVSSSITVTPPPDAAPVAKVTVTQLASPALTVSADGSQSTDTDLTPIASYQFDFGDGSPAVTVNAPATSAQHTYAAAGTYTVTLIATDSGSLASAPASASINVTDGSGFPGSWEGRVAASTDDAEEYATGSMYLNSSDLELVHDTSDQVVGMRWLGLTIPAGATITGAYIQFSAKESQSEATSLTINAQAADAPTTFTSTATNISSRPRTVASAFWSPVAWTSGQTTSAQKTPDLGALVQEVVSRPGWASGNPLVIIVSGTGHRTAWAWDGNASLAPLLHVDYTTGTPPPDQAPIANLKLTQVTSPALTVKADGSGSTDTDATPISSYTFTFGDGSPPVTVNAPTATAQHTYAATGTYTVTLTATDTGGQTSQPASASVNVQLLPTSGLVVYAGYYDTHHPGFPQPKPDPWMGSPGVVFVGTPDDANNNWDSSAIRVDNLDAQSVTATVVVDIGSNHFALWGARTIPGGSKLILAQTAFQNFDGSDTSPAGCFSCNPNDCLTKVVSTVPVIHVTVGTTTTDYFDTGQVLNTHGVDAAGCPYTGTRNDESTNWVEIATSVPAAFQSPNGDPSAGIELPGHESLWLGPPRPNPTRGELTIQFATTQPGPVRLGIYDVAGRLVRMSIDQVLGPGTYHDSIDLRDAPRGLYYYRLTTPEGVKNRAFVVAR